MFDQDENGIPKKPDFAAALNALASFDLDNAQHTEFSAIFYGLSGLSAADIARLSPVWTALKPDLRRKILEHMLEFGESNFEVDYRAISILSLDDIDPDVRTAAVELLWEDETVELMKRLIEIAQWDEAVDVRASAASALGRYILLGELGDLPENQTKQAQDTMMNVWNNLDEEVEVRRRALEAISNCSNSAIPGIIKEAYRSHDQQLRISAVFAMGRSCDERWEEFVLRELESGDPEMRYEAARAAGELELVTAVPRLARLAFDDDYEIREVTIWSLGEIGSKEALRVLDRLAEEADESGNDELLEAIEDAVANASLVGGDLPFMLDIDEDLDDEDMRIVSSDEDDYDDNEDVFDFDDLEA